jgi:hypothetical protein
MVKLFFGFGDGVILPPPTRECMSVLSRRILHLPSALFFPSTRRFLRFLSWQGKIANSFSLSRALLMEEMKFHFKRMAKKEEGKSCSSRIFLILIECIKHSELESCKNKQNAVGNTFMLLCRSPMGGRETSSLKEQFSGVFFPNFWFNKPRDVGKYQVRAQRHDKQRKPLFETFPFALDVVIRMSVDVESRKLSYFIVGWKSLAVTKRKQSGTFGWLQVEANSTEFVVECCRRVNPTAFKSIHKRKP